MTNIPSCANTFIVSYHLIVFYKEELIMSENKSLRDRISKKLRQSENKFLKKIGKKIKKPTPLPGYEKYFKEFEFKKSDIKAQIDKNAKFKNKKITKDLIAKDYEENVYKKIVKCLKKFAKTIIHASDQYNKLVQNPYKICENLIDDKLKNERDTVANNFLNTKNKETSTASQDYLEKTQAFFEQRKKLLNEFSADIVALEPDKTYFSDSNFKSMYERFKNEKEAVIKSYNSTENTINEKTIEENNEKIENALNKEYNEITTGFNKYVNVLEKFQKKYKIEHDASLKVKF